MDDSLVTLLADVVEANSLTFDPNELDVIKPEIDDVEFELVALSEFVDVSKWNEFVDVSKWNETSV
jgi:GH25 family lysozyme M1 (1,4-beta-N-acetylmuramidase)